MFYPLILLNYEDIVKIVNAPQIDAFMTVIYIAKEYLNKIQRIALQK
ncbi:MAG: hypothetical protein ISS28_07755 [Candidatus Cloacimonetes bacterium]|nr:hypothetical protein [Candidatus Cloacimonadota bacterium]MBL7086971.1 hypothetical protein [Candidatus Cloacimonadota bacterium]